jgi:hypothetical protein
MQPPKPTEALSDRKRINTICPGGALLFLTHRKRRPDLPAFREFAESTRRYTIRRELPMDVVGKL